MNSDDILLDVVHQHKRTISEQSRSHSIPGSIPGSIHGSIPGSISLPTSPHTNKRILEHNFEVENEKIKTVWKSCCFEIDKRMVQYFTQTVIIVSIMIFCCNRIIVLDSCEGGQFISLLTFLIGIIIPTPNFKQNVGKK